MIEIYIIGFIIATQIIRAYNYFSVRFYKTKDILEINNFKEFEKVIEIKYKEEFKDVIMWRNMDYTSYGYRRKIKEDNNGNLLEVEIADFASFDELKKFTINRLLKNEMRDQKLKLLGI